MDSLRLKRRLVLLTAATAIVVMTLGPSSPSGAAPPEWVTTPAPVPTGFVDDGRIFSAAATMADDSAMVVYGGQAPDTGAMADTWRSDGSAWQPVCGTTIPPATGDCGPGPRLGHGLSTGPGGVVLFGGSSEADTWTFDGAGWTQACDTASCGPTPRQFPSLAGNASATVLFGGDNGGAASDETWIWDGSTWTQICGGSSPACGPSPRVGAAFAWDGNQFVLFGGAESFGGVPLGDTWTFDGTTWSQVCGGSASPCGPAPRALAGMTRLANPDPSLAGAVLVGGGDIFGESPHALYPDAWHWNGTAWTPLPVPWPSDPVTWSDPDPPPAGPAPLLTVAAHRAANCTVTLLGTVIGEDAGEPTFTGASYTAGWDLDGDGDPSGCTPPPPPTTATTSPPTTSPPTTAVTEPEPDQDVQPTSLAATGRRSLGPQAVFAAALLLTGLMLATAGERHRYRVDPHQPSRRHPPARP